jgi:2-methylcitrate dehydratase PrpD
MTSDCPSSPDVTALLAGFVAEPPQLPPGDAAALVRRAFADVAAVAIAARSSRTGQLIVDYVARQEARGDAGVIGSTVRTTAELAALANGTLAHALDFDDTNFVLLGHPSCHLVPAALAVGEEVGASYGECIEAFMVGFQVENAVASGLNPSHFEAGFHPTGTLATLGACATAARLLRLSREKAAFALGIAASRAAGVRSNVGTMTKPLHAGMAAMSGVQAAKLAAMGWDASPIALEGPLGFTAAFAGGDEPRSAAIVERLGAGWAIAEPASLVVKPYPSCAATHPPIQAAIALYHDIAGAPRLIEGAEVLVSDAVVKILRETPPKTGNEARFSLEYTVACGLHQGRVTPADFEDEAVRRPELVDLMERIRRLPPHGRSYDFGASVSVGLVDGRSLSRVADDNAAEAGATDDAVRDKFLSCVADVVDGQAAWQIIRLGPDGQRAATIVAATSPLTGSVAA